MTHEQKYNELVDIMRKYGITHRLLRHLTKESKWKVHLWTFSPENERSVEIPDNHFALVQKLAEMLEPDPNSNK